MSKKRKIFSPITILMIVVVIAALATWLVPAGRYNTLIFQDNNFKYNTEIAPANRSRQLNTGTDKDYSEPL